MIDEGHIELQELVDNAHDAAQQCPAADTNEVEFRKSVVLALRNLGWRVYQLEGALNAAEETIARLEGK